MEDGLETCHGTPGRSMEGGEFAGKPDSVPENGRRPSIWDLRYRQASVRSTRGLVGGPPAPLLDLAPRGVYQPPRSPGMLVVSYTTVSPLPVPPKGPSAVWFLWHFPSGRPAWALPSSLSCGVRTFLDCPGQPRPSGELAADGQDSDGPSPMALPCERASGR